MKLTALERATLKSIRLIYSKSKKNNSPVYIPAVDVFYKTLNISHIHNLGSDTKILKSLFGLFLIGRIPKLTCSSPHNNRYLIDACWNCIIVLREIPK